MAVFTALAGLITSAFFSVAGALGATLATAGLAAIGTAIGYIGAAFIYGGIALGLSSITTKKADFGSTSPTYASGVLQTQTNQDLPVPLLYGRCKLAGNRIWQDENYDKAIKRIVAFAEGEITAYEDIRLNDIKMSEISGISVKQYYGTSTQNVDEIVGGSSQQERAEKVGSLRNIAYLAISVPKNEKIDINYNLTAIVKGRKVRVYTTPDAYEIKYSENPAWCLLDFLICYNGLGLGLNNDGTISDEKINKIFDIYSFIESAAFCDEEVETNGKKAPRFTFNMIFDSQTSARSLLDEIYRSCRGGLFTKNGKLQFKIDKAGPVCQHIDEDAIVKGSETFESLPSEEHYDILKCVYISPEHEWQKVEAYAELPEYRDGVPIEHSVNIYSCTNFEQASRLAWYYINSKILQPYFGSFQTDYRVYDREVGDIITFDSLLMGLKKYPVKITSIVDDGAGTFTVNWRHYDERLYSDELGSKEPHILVSDLSDLVVIPPDVENFNVIQSSTLFNFVWKSCGEGISYEIREGESWENSSLVKREIYGTTTSLNIDRRGLYKFWIKAFNGYNYSKNATLDVISVSDIPNVDEFVYLDILKDLGGNFDNTKKIVIADKYDIRDGTAKNAITLKVNNVLWQNLAKYWLSAAEKIEDDYYNNGRWWGADVISSGSYESQIYDIGRLINCIVSFDVKTVRVHSRSNITIEWCYSNDGKTFTPWLFANSGEYTFRYCKFRALFSPIDNTPLILTAFKVNIDVPEIEIKLETVITDAEKGAVVEFDFIHVPTIVATVNDSIDAYAVVVEKTNKYAKILAYKNDGTPTTCTVNIIAKGY